MTYCSPLATPLQKHIEAKKTLDEIGMEICGDSVKNPRRKAIRLIRILLGEKTLNEFAESLHYDVEKANLSKKRKLSPQLKCVRASEGIQQQTTLDCEEDKINKMDSLPNGGNELSLIMDAVSVLIASHGKDLFMEALATLKIIAPTSKETCAEMNSIESNCQNTTNPVETTPVAISGDSEHEKIIIEYIKTHPETRIIHILNDTKIKLIAILPIMRSMLERGIINKTESGLYIASTHDTHC